MSAIVQANDVIEILYRLLLGGYYTSPAANQNFTQWTSPASTNGISILADDNLTSLSPLFDTPNGVLGTTPLGQNPGSNAAMIYVKKNPYAQEINEQNQFIYGGAQPLVVIGPTVQSLDEQLIGGFNSVVRTLTQVRVNTPTWDGAGLGFTLDGQQVNRKVVNSIRAIIRANKNNPTGTAAQNSIWIDSMREQPINREPPVYRTFINVRGLWMDPPAQGTASSPIVQVTTGVGNAINNGSPFAFAQPVPAGQVIIVVSSLSSGNSLNSAISVTDNNSNTYIIDAKINPGSVTSGCVIAHCINQSLKTALQPTVNYSGAGAGTLSVVAYACVGLIPIFSNSQAVTTSPFNPKVAGALTVWTVDNGGSGINPLTVTPGTMGLIDVSDLALNSLILTACGRGAVSASASSAVFQGLAGSFS